MSDYTNDALFGTYGGGALGADMLNPAAAQSATDWGAILANGIRGAAQGAIAAKVGGAYASGQLVNQQAAQAKGNSQFLTLLLVGGVLYALTRG